MLIGTAASLATNVATAQPGTISRIIAGWPALALLIAVKLLSGMLEHHDTEGDASAVPVPAADPVQDGPRPKRPAPAPTGTAGRRKARRTPSGDNTTRPAATSLQAGPQPVGAVALTALTADVPVSHSQGPRIRSGPGPSPIRLPTLPPCWLRLALPGMTCDEVGAQSPATRSPPTCAVTAILVRNARLTPLLRVLREEATSPAA